MWLSLLLTTQLWKAWIVYVHLEAPHEWFCPCFAPSYWSNAQNKLNILEVKLFAVFPSKSVFSVQTDNCICNGEMFSSLGSVNIIKHLLGLSCFYLWNVCFSPLFLQYKCTTVTTKALSEFFFFKPLPWHGKITLAFARFCWIFFFFKP